MMVVMRVLFLAALSAASACAFATQDAQVSRDERADAIVRALASGDLARFEAAAQEHYAPSFLASSSAEARQELFARLNGDLGEMEILDRQEGDDGVGIVVEGATGMRAIFEFNFAAGADTRVTGYSLRVGGGGGAGGVRMPPVPIDSTMTAAEMRRRIDAWLAPAVEAEDFSGVVAIGRHGSPYLVLAYGLADRERSVSVESATAFNIASIGKIFTQTAIARLIQEGRLSLDSTIGDILPDYPVRTAHAATVEQLIDHRVGVADFFGPQFDALPKQQFNSNHAYYEFVSAQPLRFAPGERSEYCNGCYIVLGEMIERVSGMSFEDYVRRSVFEPADMDGSGYFRRDSAAVSRAAPYMRSEGGMLVNASENHGISGSAAGGLYSTAADLLAFDRALREGILLNPEWTAWVVGGDTGQDGRNVSGIGIAGGASGVNAILQSDDEWSVAVVANVDPPLPSVIGAAIARRLKGS